MSVLNGEKYLRAAIDSITGQTFEDFEFVIIDNGSTDETPNIIGSYTDPRIVCHRNAHPLTLTQALNQGLEIAQGDLVARLDADDIATPDRLKKQVDYLDRHPEIVLLGSNLQHFELDESGRIRHLDSPAMPCDHQEIFESLASMNPVGHVTMMYRLKEVREVGGYPEHLIYAQDLGLLHRLAHRHRFAALQDRLTLVRQHPDQISSQESWARIRLLEAISLFKDGIRLPGMTAVGKARGREGIAKCYFSMCRVDMRDGKWWSALAGLIKGTVTSPSELYHRVFRSRSE